MGIDDPCTVRVEARRTGADARGVRTRPTILGALASLALLAALPAGAMGAATPAQAIGFLNAQRAANGIPAGIAENPAWSEGCRLHNDYLRYNDLFEHDEDPTKPLYSVEGDAAAGGSVLSRASFGDGRNPWENAPMHLMQLLGPRLSVTGANDAGGYACMWTWAGYQRAPAATDTLYSYPGDGAGSVPPEQIAVEEPFVPGDFVGLAQGTTTGPHLFLLADGPWVATGGIATVRAAALAGPEGPVEVRSVTNATPDIGGLLPPGAILVPARPLRPGTLYQAQVTIRSASGVQVSRAWSFRTGRLPNAVQIFSVTADADRVEVIAQSDALNVAVRVEGARILGGRDPLEAGGGQYRWVVTVSRKPTSVCVTSGGGSDSHEAAERCAPPEGAVIAPSQDAALRPGSPLGCVVRALRTAGKVRLAPARCARGLVVERRVGRRWVKMQSAVRLPAGRRLVWRARLGARVVARGSVVGRRG